MLPDSLVIAAGRLGSLRKNGGAESAARLILSRISAPSPSPRDVLQSVIVLEAEGLLSFTKPSHHEITDRILRGGAFPESGRIPVDWKNPVEALLVLNLYLYSGFLGIALRDLGKRIVVSRVARPDGKERINGAVFFCKSWKCGN